MGLDVSEEGLIGRNSAGRSARVTVVAVDDLITGILHRAAELLGDCNTDTDVCCFEPVQVVHYTR